MNGWMNYASVRSVTLITGAVMLAACDNDIVTVSDAQWKLKTFHTSASYWQDKSSTMQLQAGMLVCADDEQTFYAYAKTESEESVEGGEGGDSGSARESAGYSVRTKASQYYVIGCASKNVQQPTVALTDPLKSYSENGKKVLDVSSKSDIQAKLSQAPQAISNDIILSAGNCAADAEPFEMRIEAKYIPVSGDALTNPDDTKDPIVGSLIGCKSAELTIKPLRVKIPSSNNVTITTS